MFGHTLVAAVALGGSVALGVTLCPAAATTTPATSPTALAAPGSAGRTTKALARAASAASADVLAGLVNRTGPHDPRYYSRGVWMDGSPDCFRCTFGPAVLAAVEAVTGSDRRAKAMAIRSFSKAIRSHQLRDGAMAPAAPGGGQDIETVLFSNELAAAYLILGHRLPRGARHLWKRSIARSASYLISNGNLRYYVNGNVNLAVSVNMDLAWRITRQKRFRRAAQQALHFTVAPTAQWSGFGLVYITIPTRADGADGSAYLAESGGGQPGFDASYTMMQADIAAQWYLLTRNPAALRLANLMLNQLLPMVRTSDWTIDVSNGSRHPTSGLRYSFTTSALAVVALRGGRTDMAGLVDSQVHSLWASYSDATQSVQPGMSFGFGLEMASVQLALLR